MPNKAVFYGFNPPFFGGQQNVMSRQEDERLIKNDILQLIMTLPGERVYRPNFGSPLRAIVFETLSDGDLLSLASNIKRAIEDNEDRVRDVAVNCVTENEGQIVRVRVAATLVNRPLIRFAIDLAYNQSGVITLSR